MTIVENIFAPLQSLMTPQGFQDLIIAPIEAAKRDLGPAWLERFDHELPDVVFLVNMTANTSDDEALPALEEFARQKLEEAKVGTLMEMGGKAYISLFFRNNAPWLRDMHARIRTEIDRPRF